MDGVYDSPGRSFNFNTTPPFHDTSHREDRRRKREGSDGKTRHTSVHQAHTPFTSQHVLALNGQPYPTLPFSLGGYGLEENINQIKASRRMGKGTLPHQRRPSRYRVQPSSRPHDRRRSIAQSPKYWREHTSGRGAYRPQPRTLSHPSAQILPTVPSAAENNRVYNQQTFNAVMWQKNVATDLGFKNRHQHFSAETSWTQQWRAHAPPSRTLHSQLSGYGEFFRTQPPSFRILNHPTPSNMNRRAEEDPEVFGDLSSWPWFLPR